MGCVGRAQLDVRRIIGYGKIVAEVLSGFCILLLWKAACVLDETRKAGGHTVPVEAYGAQVGGREGDMGWIENLDFWTTASFNMMSRLESRPTPTLCRH